MYDQRGDDSHTECCLYLFLWPGIAAENLLSPLWEPSQWGAGKSDAYWYKSISTSGSLISAVSRGFCLGMYFTERWQGWHTVHHTNKLQVLRIRLSFEGLFWADNVTKHTHTLTHKGPVWLWRAVTHAASITSSIPRYCIEAIFTIKHISRAFKGFFFCFQKCLSCEDHRRLADLNPKCLTAQHYIPENTPALLYTRSQSNKTQLYSTHNAAANGSQSQN